MAHQFIRMPPVWTQFVVQTDSALAQWAQDNKFIESGLENWALVDSGYYHCKFRESFNETTETNGKIFSIQGALFWYYSILFSFSLVHQHPLFIKDSSHYIALFRSS